jgi:hypothetical protein
MYTRQLARFGLGVVFLLLSAAATPAQEEEEKKITREDVPAAVLAAFTKAFPKAQIIGFTQEMEEGRVAYEVESTEGTIHRDVLYYADGTLIVIEESLPANKLPRAVKKAVQKESPGGTILLAEKLIRGKTIEYELHMKENGKEFELLIARDGKLLKREN